MVAGQKVALGRVHAGNTVTIDVTDTELVIHCDDGTRSLRRATDQPVTRIKAHRPRKAGHLSAEALRTAQSLRTTTMHDVATLPPLRSQAPHPRSSLE
jgi:hypothetical protein